MLQVTPPCRIAVGALLLKMACVFFKILCSMGSLSAVRMLLDKRRENTRERRDSIGGGGWGGGIGGGGAVCDVNAYSGSGSSSYSKCTALHIATRHRHMEIVKLLLQVPCPSPRPPPLALTSLPHLQNGSHVNALAGDGCSALALCLQPAAPPPPQAAAATAESGGGGGSPGLSSGETRLESLFSHSRLDSASFTHPLPLRPPPLQLHPLLQSSPLTVAV